jgi:hypothetical protein
VPADCITIEAKISTFKLDAKDGNEYTIENLLAATTYEIQVLAVNGAASSDFSEPLNCTTLSAPPGEVRNFNYEIENGKSVFFWSLPCRPNGKLINFVIEAKPTDGGEVINVVIPYDESREVYSANETNLVKGLVYEVTIEAVNEKGRGKNASIEEVRVDNPGSKILKKMIFIITNTSFQPEPASTSSFSELFLLVCVIIGIFVIAGSLFVWYRVEITK